jgi:sugar lactone lactonase YvrE
MGGSPRNIWRRRCAALLAAVVSSGAFAVLTASPAQADFIVTPLRTVPSPWISGHAFLYAWGAATKPDGTVLIGDYRNYNVAKFKADGSYLGRTMDNQGFAPYGLGVDPRNGDSYIADMERRQIRKFSNAGKFMLRFGKLGSGVGKFQYPSRVSVGSDGRIYVNDTWENQVVVHTPEGVELFTFGSFGTLPGQWKQPHGMDFDRGNPADATDDRLYVVDSGNFRIQVYDTEGNFLFQFGKKGTGVGEFRGDLRGLAIDQVNDWVYVVDAAGPKIHKFDLNGNPLLMWGAAGSGPGQFIDGGRELTVDNEGKVWVSDMPGYRVQVFNSNGKYVFERPFPALPPPDGGFNGPRGVAVDGNGNVFVTDTYNQRVQKLGPDGSFITKWGERGRGPYAFNYARLLDNDPRNGDIVVVDTDNHVVKKYTNSGTFIWEKGGPGNTGGTVLGKFKNPHAVEVGPDGRIYVADSRNARIQVLSADGNALYAFGSKGTANGQFTFPRGITLDPDGSIWVADAQGRDVVHHFTNAGTYLGKVGEPGLLDHQLKNPFDVLADEDYVYVADTQSSKIKVFEKNGTYVGSFGGPGKLLGNTGDPQGLDWGPDGTMYVTELKNERVQQFAIIGPSSSSTTMPVVGTSDGDPSPPGLDPVPVGTEGESPLGRGVLLVALAVGMSALVLLSRRRTWRIQARAAPSRS